MVEADAEVTLALFTGVSPEHLAAVARREGWRMVANPLRDPLLIEGVRALCSQPSSARSIARAG